MAIGAEGIPLATTTSWLGAQFVVRWHVERRASDREARAAAGRLTEDDVNCVTYHDRA